MSKDDSRPKDWFPHVVSIANQAVYYRDHIRDTPMPSRMLGAIHGDTMIGLLLNGAVCDAIGIDLVQSRAIAVWRMAQEDLNPLDALREVYIHYGKELPEDDVNRIVYGGYLLHHMQLIEDGVDCEADPELLEEIIDRQLDGEKNDSSSTPAPRGAAGTASEEVE